MEKGDWKVAAAKTPQEVIGDFAEEFIAYVTVKGKPVRIAGPDSVHDRRLRCALNPGEGLSVTTNGLSTHAVHARPRGEQNNGIPVELGIPEDRPLSLREEMMRFIRDEMSRQSLDQGQESFEEANDFDVDDDDQLYSPYELIDMEAEELAEDLETKADSEAEAEAVEKESAEPAEDAGQAKEKVA